MDTNKDNYYLIQALHGTRKYYSKIGSSRRNSLMFIIPIPFREVIIFIYLQLVYKFGGK